MVVAAASSWCQIVRGDNLVAEAAEVPIPYAAAASPEEIKRSPTDAAGRHAQASVYGVSEMSRTDEMLCENWGRTWLAVNFGALVGSRRGVSTDGVIAAGLVRFWVETKRVDDNALGTLGSLDVTTPTGYCRSSCSSGSSTLSLMRSSLGIRAAGSRPTASSSWSRSGRWSTGPS